MLKRVIISTFLFLFLSVGLFAQGFPPSFFIQGRMGANAQGAFPEGCYDVEVELYGTSNITSGVIPFYTGDVIGEVPGLPPSCLAYFSRGFFKLPLDSQLLSANVTLNVTARLSVPGFPSADFTLSAIPYASYVKLADTVSQIDAAKLSNTGVSFNGLSVSVNRVSDALKVFKNDALNVNSYYKKVGIVLPVSPLDSYVLNVGGGVKASGYALNGTPLFSEEGKFQKKLDGPESASKDIYVLNSKLFLAHLDSGTGIPESSDLSDALFVQNGTLWARDFYLNGRPIPADINWKTLDADPLTYVVVTSNNSPTVSVALANTVPVEALTLSDSNLQGGLLIGDRHDLSLPTENGAIFFKNGAFYGVINGAVLNLMGIRGTGVAGNVVVWDNALSLNNSSLIKMNTNSSLFSVAYPTGYPARLTVGNQFASPTVFRLDNSNGDSVFLVQDSGLVVAGQPIVPTAAFLGISGFTVFGESEGLLNYSRSNALWVFLNAQGYLTPSGNLTALFNADTTVNLSAFSVSDGRPALSTSALEPIVTQILGGYRSGSVFNALKQSRDRSYLRLEGDVDATQFYVGGVPLQDAYINNSHFFKSPQPGSTRSNLFYLAGNLGIGRENPNNLLQIGSPLHERDNRVATIDPVILFSPSMNSAYGFGVGVDADDLGVFRVERLIQPLSGAFQRIGEANPLFVSLENRFGVGVQRPFSNLHVSGNMLVEGKFAGSPIVYVGGFVTRNSLIVLTNNSFLLGSGSRLAFFPSVAALRLGLVDSTSPLLGEDWDYTRIRDSSMALGYNGTASDNFSTVIGGRDLVVGGPYSTLIGGRLNRVDGYFSTAFGYRASVPHHGSFLFQNFSNASNFSVKTTSAHDQFLVYASGGMGINRAPFSGTGLTIKGRSVVPSDFVALSGLSTEEERLRTSQAIFNFLTANETLSAQGDFNLYIPEFSADSIIIAGSVTFSVDVNAVYALLSSKKGLGQFVRSSDFLPYLTASASQALAKSTWIHKQKQSLAFTVRKSLIDAGALTPSGDFRTDGSGGLTLNIGLFNNAITNLGSGIVDSSGLLSFLIGDGVLGGHIRNYSFLTATDIADSNTLNPALFSDAAWTSYLNGPLTTQVSERLFESFVTREYIHSDGTFFRFSAPLSFSGPFNGESISTSSVKAILDRTYFSKVFDSLGVSNIRGLSVFNAGQAGIGFDTLTEKGLFVSGSVGIGVRASSRNYFTLIDSAALTDTAETQSLYIPSLVQNSLDPYLSFTKEGLLGVGNLHSVSTNSHIDGPVLVKVKGPVIAGLLRFKTGETVSGRPAGPDWLYFNTTPNIYFTSGNVGMGVLSPNALLTLGNIGGLNPQIGFDLDGTDYYILGLHVLGSRKTLRIANAARPLDPGALVVSSNRVGIGTSSPLAPLHVSGSVQLLNLLITTANNTQLASGIVVSVDSLEVTRELLVSGNLAELWRVGTGARPPIYFPFLSYPSIGIGGIPHYDSDHQGLAVMAQLDSSRPTFDGVVSANRFTVSSRLNFLNGLQRLELKLPNFASSEDINGAFDDSIPRGTLKLHHNDLVLLIPDQPTINISNVVVPGTGQSGPLANWSTPVLLSDSEIIWQVNPSRDNTVGHRPWLDTLDSEGRFRFNPAYDFVHMDTLFVSGNLNISQGIRPSMLIATHNFSLSAGQPDVLLNSNLVLDKVGEGTILEDYTAYPHSLTINQSVSGDVTIAGLDLQFNSGDDRDRPGTYVYLTNTSTLTGLSVDVSGINIQESTAPVSGYKAAAVFMGSVGIGVTPNDTFIVTNNNYLSPGQYVLDVPGTINVVAGDKPAGLVLSNGLFVREIEVGSNLLVADSLGGVGIGTRPSQTASLNVMGGIKAQAFISRDDIKAGMLQVGQGLTRGSNGYPLGTGKFIVNETGFVGVNTGPLSGVAHQFSLHKVMSPDFVRAFTYKTIRVTDGLLVSQEYTGSITGLDIKLHSRPESGSFRKNLLGRDQTATGLSINLSGVTVTENATLLGVFIQSKPNNDNPSAPRYLKNAAIFQGGPVVVGGLRPRPGFLLDVNGTLHARNIGNGNPLIFLSDPLVGSFNRLRVNDDLRIGSLGAPGAATVNTLTLFGTFSGDINVLGSRVTLNSDLSLREFSTEVMIVTTNIAIGNLVVNRGLRVNSISLPRFSTIGNVSNPLRSLSVLGGVRADSVTVDGFLSARSIQSVGRPIPFVLTSASKMGLGTLSPVSLFDLNGDILGPPSYSNRNSYVHALISSERQGAGILFETGGDPQGAGILTVESAGSYPLIFATNANESFRLTPQGYLGIGTSNPMTLFSLSGNMLVRGSLSLPQPFDLRALNGLSGFNIPNSVFVSGDASIDGVTLASSFVLKESLIPNALSITSGNPYLYVDSSDVSRSLFFLRKNGDGSLTTGNFKIPFLGTTPYSLPYFQSSGILSSIDAPGVFSITGNGTPSLNVTLSLGLDIDTTFKVDSAGFQPAVLIHPLLKTRSRLDEVNTTFTGMRLQAHGNVLRNEDEIVGVRVSMDALLNDVTIIDGTTSRTRGEKYAALFNGGAVGLRVTGNSSISVSPNALFHVIGTGSSFDLWSSQSNRMNRLGYLSLNDSTYSALLRIRSTDFRPILKAVQANSTMPFVVDSGVGIGVSSSVYALSIAGNVSLNRLVAQGLSSQVLSVGTQNFSVTGSGRIGMGTSSPETPFHVMHAFNDQNIGNMPYLLSRQESGFNALIDRDVVGVLVEASSNAGTVLGGAKQLTGMSVDFTGLKLNSGASLIGMSITTNGDVTQDVTAIFNGGAVGIGTQTPGTMLDVQGTIIGRDLLTSQMPILDGSVVTLDSLVVTGGANMPASHLSMTALERLSLTKLSMSSFTSGQSIQSFIDDAEIESRLHLISSYAPTMNVSGNFLLNGATVIRPLSVSGNAYLNGTMWVSSNYGVSLHTIAAPNTLTFLTPTVSMESGLTVSDNLRLSLIRLTPIDTASIGSGLYTRLSDSALYYKSLSGSDVNLSSQEQDKRPYALPYFVDSGVLTGSIYLTITSNASVSVSVSLLNTANVLGVVRVTSDFLIQGRVVDPLDGISAMNQVNLKFPRRIVPSTALFLGANLTITGNQTGGSSSATDYVTGLFSNLNDLQDLSTTEEPVESERRFRGTRYSGLFLGGPVVIQPLSSGTLQAAIASFNRLVTANEMGYLYVDVANAPSSQNIPLWIHSTPINAMATALTTPPSFVIQYGPTSSITLGGPVTVNSAAQFSVIASSNKEFLFSAKDDDSRSLMAVVVSSNIPYVGFGTETPTYNLHIVGGDATRDLFRVSGSLSPTYSIQVSGNGLIGLGPVLSGTNLNVAGGLQATSILDRPVSGTVLNAQSVVLTTNAQITPTNNVLQIFNRLTVPATSKTLFDVTMTVSSNVSTTNIVGSYINFKGSSLTSATANGLIVDVRDLAVFATTDAKVAASFRSTLGSGSSLVLDTKVGIGSERLNAALHISGNVTSNLLYLSAGGPGIDTFKTEGYTYFDSHARYGSALGFQAEATSSIAPGMVVALPRSSFMTISVPNGQERRALTEAESSALYDELVAARPSNIVFPYDSDSGSRYESVELGVSANGQFVMRADPVSFRYLLTGAEISTTSVGIYTVSSANLHASLSGPASITTNVLPRNFFTGLNSDHKDTGPHLLTAAESEALYDILLNNQNSFLNLDTDVAIGLSGSSSRRLTVVVTRNPGVSTWSAEISNIVTQFDYLSSPQYSLFVPAESVSSVLNSFKDVRAISLRVGEATPNSTAVANSLTILSGLDPVLNSGLMVGRVGVFTNSGYRSVDSTYKNTNMLDTAFTVSGNLYVGWKRGAVAVEGSNTSEGKPLLFGGGDFFSGDTDNKVPLSMVRKNGELDQSSLLVKMGSESSVGTMRFDVGYTSTDNVYKPVLSVNTHPVTSLSNDSSAGFGRGYVGIGVTDPRSPVHVLQDGGSTAVVKLESKQDPNGNLNQGVLMLQDDSIAGPEMSSRNQFISFLGNINGDLADLGSIEGYSGDTTLGLSFGLTYTSSGQDYAEYLPKRNSMDHFEPGDVVGVFGGKISHSTLGADHIMAISSYPIVVGNWNENSASTSGLVAFLGQVPVSIRGVVEEGDYIVASGLEDGTAIAISPDQMTGRYLDLIIGRALESSYKEDAKLIKILVGFDHGRHIVMSQLAAAQTMLGSLSQLNVKMEQDLLTRYQDRQAKIMHLKTLLK